MPLPIDKYLAFGSLLTAIKSGWELSRMITKKLEDIELNKLVTNASRSLRSAFNSGCISHYEYYKYKELIAFAEAQEDVRQLLNIRNKLARLRASSDA
ncbi:hypothetical protein BKA67DRAFT_695334 [Truncatella angustata]|uniref:Uncharacterized protein n=1 Tax=Truncatella angustata TaxID=152316 RepID=A0A9P8RNP4_9PEZI|nr:uncharacterized protein BKA67DRAFT_695334 [Truncatella angustata]KAH6646815.1 hypothetical protein BKA67DRAFT_695334 [Truncatella angustata]